MASQINVSGLSLATEEASKAGEVIHEIAFIQNELSLFNEIETGISHDQQIVFSSNLDVGGEALTGCTPAEQTGISFSEKTWSPKIIAGRYTHCANDLSALLKLFKKAQKMNPDFFDRVNSEEIGMLVAKIAEGMKVSIFAKAWYGDTAAAVTSSAGDFTIGTNLATFNQFGGLWKQIFADVDVPVYAIGANSEATANAQVLADGESKEILTAIYNNADERLLGHPDVQIGVTRSIWKNLVAYMEDVQKLGGFIDVLEDGRKSIDFRGIPVVMMSEWDRLQNKNQTDGVVVNKPNRALMTVPSNVKIGTLNEGDMTTLDSWYEKKDKSNIIDFVYSLDASFGEAYLASAAY